MRMRWMRSALAGAVLAAAVGCGATPPPGDAAPGLRAQLSRIDTALAGRQYGTARTALDALVREAVAARDAGTITTDQADRILAAAARLAADLPAQTTPSPTPRATETPAEQDSEKKDEGKKDNGKKDEDTDGGDSGSRPDDGHGN